LRTAFEKSKPIRDPTDPQTQQAQMSQTVAGTLVDVLEQIGVRHIFGLTSRSENDRQSLDCKAQGNDSCSYRRVINADIIGYDHLGSRFPDLSAVNFLARRPLQARCPRRGGVNPATVINSPSRYPNKKKAFPTCGGAHNLRECRNEGKLASASHGGGRYPDGEQQPWTPSNRFGHSLGLSRPVH
jgi:hypothetical protein